MVLKLAKLAFVTVGYAIVNVVAGSVTSSSTAAINSNGGTEETSLSSGEYFIIFASLFVLAFLKSIFIHDS